MLNAADIAVNVPPAPIVYEDDRIRHAMQNGRMNTNAATILENIRSSIRRGHPQMQGGPLRKEKICLVGSGPSLEETLPELRQLLWEGATLVTLNGAYHWCIERNLRPQTQIVMDARPCNSRFLFPNVPRCNYVLASQCAPEVWDAVADRPHVRIFHAVVKGEEDASQMLDAYYAGNWIGVGGGVTVASRALGLLRMSGYLRFHLFGIDCCWKGDQHHALSQPENEHDRRLLVRYGVTDQIETQREFIVSDSMLKQLEDFMTILHVNGKHFQIAVHGDGLLAYAIQTLGSNAVMTTIGNV